MLRSASEMTGYVLKADDGEIGRCKDFLFDDEQWTVRYMVADTAKWLPGRKVLISPISLGEPDWSSKRFPVSLTREQIEQAPDLDEDAPVSRDYERSILDFYHYPYYWLGDDLWAGAPTPGGVVYPQAPPPAPEELESDPEQTDAENHLRSVKEVRGYHLDTPAGGMGHVDDFIVDTAPWTIRYLVANTRKWLPGKDVLLSTDWLQSVDWVERKVAVDVERERIKHAPEYDPAQPVDRDYERQIFDYYGRPTYW